MAAIHGKAHAFGIMPVSPMVGFPEGKVRIRMRVIEFVRVSVKTPNGFRHFRVRWNENGDWIPGVEIGRTEISE